jgi:flagellar motility protein MotE (MotC chaperone)
VNSEKIKEIKKVLNTWKIVFHGITNADILTYINELESENERLSKEREDLRLFDIALGNGKVDMSLGGNTAKSFINAIVQIFEQNNATNFLATTIETISSGNKYSLVIQKENGQTPSEKLTKLKDRIAVLESENGELKKHVTEVEKGIINIAKERNKKDELASKFIDSYNDSLKQFAERLKEKVKNFCGTEYENAYYDVTKAFACNDIDETLKEALDTTV